MSPQLPSPRRAFPALTCCPKHLPKAAAAGKGVFLMEKVELSAGNTEQRAQLPEKDSPSSSCTLQPHQSRFPAAHWGGFHKLLPPCQEGKWGRFSHSAVTIQAFRDAVPHFPLQYQALGSRMLQNKVCEEVPGHDLLPEEVSGFMVLWKRRMEEDKECRRLWEANLRRGGVGCQGGFWTNPEHRGLQCLQLVCRHGNGLAKDGRWKNKPGAH